MSLTPNEAVDLLCQRLAPLEAEALDLADAAGRIVAQPIHADRDSPPCDTSAMDAYALRGKG